MSECNIEESYQATTVQYANNSYSICYILLLRWSYDFVEIEYFFKKYIIIIIPDRYRMISTFKVYYFQKGLKNKIELKTTTPIRAVVDEVRATLED